MNNGPRVVRCTVEMDLIEGEHFNPSMRNRTDQQAINLAVSSFVDMLDQNAPDYVQARLLINTEITEQPT